MTFGAWVGKRFGSANAVYGTILYAALIAVVSDKGTEALEVLLVSLFSLVVFWSAHVFAETVAGHGVKEGHEVRLRMAFREALENASGMLYAAIIPSLVMLLGVFHVTSTDDAVSLALLVATITLGVLGYIAFAQRKSRVIFRILGGLGTATFGLFIILLNIVVH